MYGSIFSLKPKQGMKEDLIDSFKDNSTPEGMISWYLMNPDDDGDLIGIAMFKSKEAYKLNAERPETHQNFIKMMEFLNEEPLWNDGEFVIGETA